MKANVQQFQNCKYGYRDIYETAEVVQNYSRAGIPLETMWNDIDYMDRRRVFTNDPQRYPLSKMREFVDYLHDHNQHYIVMVDPAVSASSKYTGEPICLASIWLTVPDNTAFKHGLDQGIFLQTQNGSLYKGASNHYISRTKDINLY